MGQINLIAVNLIWIIKNGIISCDEMEIIQRLIVILRLSIFLYALASSVIQRFQGQICRPHRVRWEEELRLSRVAASAERLSKRFTTFYLRRVQHFFLFDHFSIFDFNNFSQRLPIINQSFIRNSQIIILYHFWVPFVFYA